MTREYVLPGITKGKKHLEEMLRNDIDSNVWVGKTIAYDLGMGLGDSTLALAAVMEDMQELHGVDNYDSLDISRVQSVLGDSFTFHGPVDMDVFLREQQGNRVKADVIMVASVPTHYMDYDALQDCLAPKGIVIEMGDTRLDPASMIARNFALLPGSDKNNKYWQAV